MTSRTSIEGAITKYSSSQVIAANSTVAFDFGTPDDVNLATNMLGQPGERVMLIFSAVRAAGTTSTLQLVVQDANDVAGAIGTPATATVTGDNSVIAAATAGLSTRMISLVQKAGRPWLRVSVTHAGGGTDSFQCHVHVLVIPKAI